MPAGTRGGATQREVELLATPGARGVIGRGQGETQPPDDRRQAAVRLPQGQGEDEPERQRGFDGEIGILPLPATGADANGLPRGDRIRGQPHGDLASLDPRSVVCRPMPDGVCCRVLWVHDLDVMSRSCTCGRHDGQEVDRGAPRARDPCTNALSVRRLAQGPRTLGRRSTSHRSDRDHSTPVLDFDQQHERQVS